MTVVNHEVVYGFLRFEKSRNSYGQYTMVISFLKDEFVYGGHLLAVMVSLLSLSTMLVIGEGLRVEFLGISYLFCQSVYQYNHYKELDVDKQGNSRRTMHLLKYSTLFPILIVGYVIGFVSLLVVFGNLASIVFGLLLLMGGFLYTWKGKQMTEKIVGFKTFFTTGVAACFILFTSVYHTGFIALHTIVFSLFCFLNFTVNTSLCDVKDMQTDTRQGLQTFPVFFGRKRFFNVFQLLCLVSGFPLIVGVVLNILPPYTLFLLFSVLYQLVVIHKARQEKADIQKLSSIVLDGEQVLWPGLLFLGMSLFAVF